MMPDLRILKLLTWTGYLIEERDMSYLAAAESDRAFTLEASGGLHLSHRAGARPAPRVLSLQTVPSRADDSTQPGCVNAHGFSLHAAVRCGPDQRKELERLCRES